MFSMRWMAPILTGFLLVIGCSGGGNPAAPPSGWQATDTRMWKDGVDTSEVFRNLETLNAMGVTDAAKIASGDEVTQKQFVAAVKQSLVKLYRHNPTIVDSLFEKYALPKVKEADLSGDLIGKNGKLKPKLLQPNKEKAYKAITEYFTRPERKEAPSNIAYPDSLRRDEEASGRVKLQVHIDTTGAVDAVEAVQAVHPTLNRIAMKAATQTTWVPAYLQQDRRQKPVPSWARFAVPFPAPQN